MPRRQIGLHTMMGRGGEIRTPKSESAVLGEIITLLEDMDWTPEHMAPFNVRHVQRALNMLRYLHKQVAAGYHRNPSPLLVIHNPPIRVRRMLGSSRVIGVMSQDVHEIRYTHAEDNESYKHEFGDGVQMFAVERDGLRDIHLTHVDGKPLWEDFG